MGPDHGAIHEMYSPLQLASGIGLLLQLPQESLPQPLSPPPVETLATVGQGPYRSGKSRQGAPVRTTHRMPLMMVRWSLLGRPRLGLWDGNKGANLYHWASVKSPRPTFLTSLLTFAPQFSSLPTLCKHPLVLRFIERSQVPAGTRWSPETRIPTAPGAAYYI